MNSLCNHPEVLDGEFVYYESIKRELNKRLGEGGFFFNVFVLCLFAAD